MSSNIFHSGKIFSIGDRIKAIRGKLNQEEFGKIIGVKAPAVSKYEKGREPDLEALKKIAAYGGVTLDWLLHGDPKAAIPEPLPEKLSLESPPPGRGPGLHDPYLFGRVDIDALTQIIEQVEELLRRRKRHLKPVRFALLLSLLYDQFQTTGRIPDQAALQETLRRVD